MENVKPVQKQIEDWGYLVSDENGIVMGVSPGFCQQFSVKQSELADVPIDHVIQGIPLKNYKQSFGRKPVIFGLVFGYACLIRVTQELNHNLYHVILRVDEVDRSEIISFANALDKPKVKKEARNSSRYSFEEITGESQAIAQIKELAARIATSNSTVLITGESGTGKELFAQAIHELSSRKSHPFVAVNCAAIPDELFESEVFGYEAGAFSGAKKEGKPGKIEQAQNGTLFLDEISELTYQAQGKLLRVLQEREVERLGGTGSKLVDIRIVAATNRDLKTLVQEGKFRQDLYYRLYVFELKIPSLRQRKEDILPLTYHFIDEFNEKLNQNVKYIEPELQEWILNHEWPGNIRELKAYIEREMNMVDGPTLAVHSLYMPLILNRADEQSESNESTLLSLVEEVRKAEVSAIARALRECDGNRTLAAQKLDIHLASLYRKIAKYNLK
ncbi:AAA family ATPase [Peribacillus cavernae]|uniref:AAA family ATPase n=1 Tax=Peribacillus cavernae TaxID=1674310 RepID=A0A433HFQ9_9BACI|nr:sigma 54-interacting transcriptional regulator [Peribacillus cavernae]MDQ0219437.1 transcriptional regulator with PAS, ATPase and Fis domain [Peribacillus cavernae]RUQ27139.1 AAA family ATPase [Peribacillus cavernae]